MLKNFLSVFILMTLSLNAQSLVFGVPPTQNTKLSLKLHLNMAAELEERLDKKVKVAIYSTFEELYDAFLTKKVDFAHFGAYLYSKIPLSRQIPIAQFLTQDRLPFYTCTIFSNKSGVNLNDFYLHTFAVTAKISTCGSEAIEEITKNSVSKSSNMPFLEVFSDQDVVLRVMLGETRGGSIKSSSFSEYEHLGLHELHKSEPYPSDIIIANPSMSENDIKIIRDFFLKIDPYGTNRHQIRQYPPEFQYGFVLPLMGDYEWLREQLNINLPQDEK